VILRLVWQMAKVHLLNLMRDRRALVMSLIMPVLLTMILSFALGNLFGGKPLPAFSVSVYNADGGVYARALVKVLSSQTKQLTVIHAQSREAANTAIEDGKARVSVIIPSSFSDDIKKGTVAPVEINAALNHITEEKIVRAIVNAYGDQLGISAFAASQSTVVQGTGAIFQQSVGFHINNIGLRPITAGSYYAVGMMVMFLLMTAVNRAGLMVNERNSDRYHRLVSAPVARYALTTGHWLANTVVLLIQGLLLLTVAHYLLGISLGPWGQMTLLTCSYAVALAGLTVLLGSLIDNEIVMDGISRIGAQILAVLGGSILPLYNFPDVIRAISNVLPNGMVLHQLIDSVSGISTLALIRPSLMLVAMGLLLGLIGGLRYGRTI
jgi:ABC-2 type transport system permease protein